jgi:hypothetical protein
MKVASIRCTCGACPSQWEGVLVDGRTLYVRYRYGFLSAKVSHQPSDDVTDAVRGEQLFGEQVGEWLDGCMGDAEMQQHLAHILEF